MSTTLQTYQQQSFGTVMGFGASMALLIVDYQRGFADPAILGGYNMDSAVSNTVVLLKAARKASIPIAHVSFIVQDEATNLGPFGLKAPGLAKLTPLADASRIVDGLEPIRGEYFATKQHASAFFGTSLAAWLSFHRIDTLIVAGCTTSGCVRASVVDASAHGFRPIVVEECCGDRAEEPHRANLFDMQQKYADLVSLPEIEDRLRRCGRKAA